MFALRHVDPAATAALDRIDADARSLHAAARAGDPIAAMAARHALTAHAIQARADYRHAYDRADCARSDANSAQRRTVAATVAALACDWQSAHLGAHCDALERADLVFDPPDLLSVDAIVALSNKPDEERARLAAMDADALVMARIKAEECERARVAIHLATQQRLVAAERTKLATTQDNVRRRVEVANKLVKAGSDTVIKLASAVEVSAAELAAMRTAALPITISDDEEEEGEDTASRMDVDPPAQE
ncbi:hypothetical protein BC828DRAFT_408301 [Blastocladiella britannica]|nr:hypothetical protein BC828DRAFT_408301 [Blastocladiella britannica]